MMNIQVKIGDQKFDVQVGDITDRPVQVRVDGELFEVWPEEPHDGGVPVAPVSTGLSPKTERIKASPPAAAGNPTSVTAPMPGVIISVTAHPGDHVVAGDELVVLEAMKMKNPIRAIRPATVCAILVNPGDPVKKGQTLVEFSS
jgi:glutaconyl-CoA/methylmalonyl-CoA decarboxylase subunit gamma